MVQRILGGTSKHGLSFDDLGTQSDKIGTYVYTFATMGSLLLAFLFMQFIFMLRERKNNEQKVFTEHSSDEKTPTEEVIEDGRLGNSQYIPQVPDLHLEALRDERKTQDDQGQAISEGGKKKKKLMFKPDGSLSRSVVHHSMSVDDELLEPRIEDEPPSHIRFPHPQGSPEGKRKMKISMKNGNMHFETLS